jgi:endonuclease/exonuclease/phosphatase family metal-dependent hydrolase
MTYTAGPIRTSAGRAPRRTAAAVVLLLALGGCSWAHNYVDPTGPRFAGALPAPPPSDAWPDTLRVVSFNVERGVRVDSALAALAGDPETAAPDVVLLQEMDEDGARRVAEALDMGFVYYPAVRYNGSGRDFGNAVLSRWPIVDDAKLVLPHLSVFGRTQRIATAATIRVGRTRVRVYSVHLGTPVNLPLRDRAEQMRTVLRDAARHPHVILGGDFNSHGLGQLALRRGYAWPTREGPHTVRLWRWDHILFKGLEAPEEEAAGTVEDNRGASDHRPVWAVGVLF